MPKKIAGTKAQVTLPKQITFVSIPRAGLNFNVTPLKTLTIPHRTKTAYQYNMRNVPVIASHVDEMPGHAFKNLRAGEIVYVKQNGKNKSYKVTETKQYLYQNKMDPYSAGVSHEGHKMAWGDMSTGVSGKKDSVILTACITESENTSRAIGMRYAIVEPVADTAWPPRPQIPVSYRKK